MNVKFPVTNTSYGSLPPFVEGEVSLYLTLKVDQVLWKKKAPGDVTVLVRWWGENSIPVFKPRDVKKNSKNSQLFVYKIKTHINLFETYLGDSEYLELFVVVSSSNELIGSGKIKNLKRIIYENPYRIYVPILNSAGRFADLHVCFQLHDTDPLDKKLLQLDCKSLTTRKFQPVYSFCSHEGKQCLQLNTGSEKCKYNTKYWPCNSSVNNTANTSVIIPQPVKNVSSNDILLKVLDQSVKLRNAMVKSILEDDGLFMRGSTMTGNSSQSRNTRQAVGVGIHANKKVMDYLLGDVLNLDESEHLEISQNMSPVSDTIELMEKPVNVDSNLDTENLEAVREKVAPYDGTSSSEKNENEVLVCEKDIKLCRKKPLLSGEAAEVSSHIEPCKNRIRWLRVDVCQFVLQLDNVLKILGTSFLPKASFFAEFELPRDLVCPCKSKQQKPWNSQTHRFCSRKQLNNVVHFDKSISCRIQASNSDTFQKIKSSKLTFSVYFRHMKRKSPLLIGATDLSLCDILKPDAPFKYEIPVHSKIQYSDSSLIVGILIVIIEVMSSKETVRPPGIHNGFSTDQKFGNQTQMLQQYSKLSEENALQFPSEITNKICIDSHLAARKLSVEQQRFINNTSSKITAEKRNIEAKEESSKSEVPVHVLLCILEGCGFEYNSTYLVNRLLWGDKMSRSHVCCGTETPKYNFQEVIPVYLDDNFLQRCHNDTLVTEVWCDNKLLGLAQFPLQKFYNVFSDLTVREKMLKGKMPVIGHDGWVDIVNPVSGLKSGQLLVFLAAGTETQIKAFQSSNCFNLCETNDCRASDLQQLCSKRNTNAADPTVDIQQLEKHLCKFQNSLSKNILKQVPNVPSVTDAINTEYSEICEGNYTHEKAVVNEVKPTKNSHHLSDLVNRRAGSHGPTSDILLASACESNETTTESTESPVMNKSTKQTTEMEKTLFSSNSEDYDRKFAQKYHHNQCLSKFQSSRNSKENSDSLTNPECSSVVSSDIDMKLNQKFHISNSRQGEMENVRDNAMSFDINETASAEGGKHKYPSIELPSTGTSSPPLSDVCSSKVETSHPVETEDNNSCFHAHVEIVSALHLPLVKKNRKRVHPSCYVTFDTCVPRSRGGSRQLATPVAWYTTSPSWDWSCDTWLSAELLKDKNKLLIFKIWMKAESTEKDKHNLLGCVSVDLTVLLFGMPWISGWFNIMDFTGNNKGQIKINITPTESLTGFSIQQLSEENQKLPLLKEAASFFDVSSISHMPSRITQKGFPTPNKHKREANYTQSAGHSVGNTSNRTSSNVAASSSDDLADISSFLSSALQSKLLELDEITQRLKSRLSSVTQDEAFSEGPNIGLEDIIREEHKSWNSCDQSSLSNGALEEESSKTVTLGFTQEEVMLASAYNKVSISKNVVENGISHEQSKNTSYKNLQINQLDLDYNETVNKMAALSVDRSKNNETCINDFDCLTSYFRDIANKDIELENVINPLLFQQLLSFSNSQPILHTGKEKFFATTYCEGVDNKLTSCKNEEEETALKLGSDLYTESKIATSSSGESLPKFKERHKCNDKLHAEAPNLNIGFVSTGKTTSENYSLNSDCIMERRIKTHSETVCGNDDCNGSFPSEYVSFVSSNQSKAENTLRRDSMPKQDTTLSLTLASESKEFCDVENSSSSPQSNASVMEVLRLAPEGGNPTENSTHNLQNFTAEKAA